MAQPDVSDRRCYCCRKKPGRLFSRWHPRRINRRDFTARSLPGAMSYILTNKNPTKAIASGVPDTLQACKRITLHPAVLFFAQKRRGREIYLASWDRVISKLRALNVEHRCDTSKCTTFLYITCNLIKFAKSNVEELYKSATENYEIVSMLVICFIVNY